MRSKFNMFKIMAVLAALTLTLVLSSGSPLSAQEEKPFKQFHTIVEAGLVENILEGKTIGLVIDSRPKKKKYDLGHIPGAINIPDSQFEKMKGLLPADKDALIVFYCQGLKCALSHKGAYKAEKLGYKNIKVYSKGYPDWKKKMGPGCGDPDAAAKPGKILVIEGDDNVNKIMELIEKEKMTVTSGPAKPVQTGMLKPGKQEGSIDYDEFKDVVKNKIDSIILVDNRDPGEYAKGTIPGAINIPNEILEKKLEDWKIDKPLVFFCGTGARSGEAYYMIKDLRPEVKDVYYVDGEMTFDGKGGFTISPAK